jgi:membrane protease YdiL (CAAX protease family)
MINFSETIKKHSVLSFIIITFGITWIASSIYYYSTPQYQSEIPSVLGFIFSFIWYYGPCLGAFIVIRVKNGRKGLRNLFKRMVQWRVKWYWYLFILLYPLILHLTVSGIDYLVNDTPIVFFQAEGVPAGNILLTLLGLFILQIFQRGFGEETGWRGFLLPELQTKYSMVQSSVILGIIWGLWHFHPANFKSLISITGIFLFANIFLTAFLFTWLSKIPITHCSWLFFST